MISTRTYVSPAMSRFLVTALVLTCAACDRAAELNDLTCAAPATVAALPSVIREASGITFSSDPALLWVQNDSEGTPSLYSVGTDGRLRAQIDMPGAPAQFDWEDMASGPCPSGTCLYIGDIGDNLHERTDRAILRIPEPAPGAAPVAVERFPIVYPGGPEDAEAIFVLPDTTIYIVSKGRSGPVSLYRYPAPLRADEPVTLEVVQRLSEGLQQLPDMVTGAAATPDGRIVAVRSYSRVRFYSVLAGRLEPMAPDSGFGLAALREPQGEGITISADGTVYLVSEAGLEGGTSKLSMMKCVLPKP